MLTGMARFPISRGVRVAVTTTSSMVRETRVSACCCAASSVEKSKPKKVFSNLISSIGCKIESMKREQYHGIVR
jgi:hypothetical protein